MDDYFADFLASPQAASHSSFSSKELPFPPQPPYMKITHSFSLTLYPHLGKNAEHIPESKGRLQTSEWLAKNKAKIRIIRQVISFKIVEI